MMNLWLMLYVAGALDVTWGPFPADVPFEVCQQIAVDQKAAVDANVTVAGVAAADMEFRCEWRDEPPMKKGLN